MSNRTFYASTYAVADGVTRTWPFSFAGVNTGQESGTAPYLYPEDVKVQEIYTDEAGNKQTVQRTGVLNSPNQLTIDGPAVLAGREIRIYRETELRFPLVDYRDLQSVSEHDLDLANRQAVFLAQETRDTASANLVYDAQGHFNAMGRRIVNMADGVAPRDAVNRRQLDHAIRIPMDEPTLATLPPAAERAMRLLSFDSNGLPVVTFPDAESATDLEMRLRASAGVLIVGSASLTVQSLDELSRVPRDPRRLVSLQAGTRTGLFLFDSTDVSLDVAADPLRGVYVPHSADSSGATGAWVRQYGQAMGGEGVHVNWFGAAPNDPEVDSAPAWYAASVLARSKASSLNLGGNDIRARTLVTATAGAAYYIYTTVALDTQGARIDFGVTAGKVTLCGSHPLRPMERTALAFDYNLLYGTTFTGMIFAGFQRIHRWDTNNIDSAIITYRRCEFHDSGSPGEPTIDTKSFAESRSTHLVFDDCRSTNVPRLLNSYCDTLYFNGCLFRNADPNGAFILADSGVTITSGMWVPYFPGPEARWFDLYDNLRAGSRGLTSTGVRWSPEAGGIPVVYNFMNGSDAVSNRFTNSIVITGGSMAAAPGVGEHTGLVVLADDGNGNSIAPSFISINASVRARTGLVRTQKGNPVNKLRGRFTIEISATAQSHLSTQGVAPGVPLVEAQLNKYLVGQILYRAPYMLTGTADMQIEVGVGGPNATFNISGSDATVTALLGAFDGEEVTLVFMNNRGTVKDVSTGSNIYLNGGADFVTNAFGTITLERQRAGNKWIEKGRCVR